MTSVIRFTRIRGLAVVLSAAVITAGIVGTQLRGGVDLSVDLSGGIAQQFQIAPVAIALRDSTNSLSIELTPPDPLLGRTGFLSAESLQDGVLRRTVVDFASATMVADVAAELAAIPGVEVELRSPGNIPSSQLQPPGFGTQREAQLLGYIDPEAEPLAPITAVRAALSPLGKFSLQQTGDPGEQRYIVRAEVVDADGNGAGDGASDNAQARTEARIAELLGDAFGPERLTVLRTDFVGPSFSRVLGEQAVWLVIVAFALIFVYILFRFRTSYAVGALLALVHDVAIMLGVLGTFQLEISTATIAAVLTIVGYSLNDTIVIFDRIRENTTLMRDADLETVINTSITQSLGRTVITSLTTLLAVTAIYIFGTAAIQTFALSLIIGVVVGTYSSIFVASTALLSWQRIRQRRASRSATASATAMQAPSAPPEPRPGTAVTGGSSAGTGGQAPAPTGTPAPGTAAGGDRATSTVTVTRTQRKRTSRKRRKR